jgi:hypothetical protein
MKTHSQQDSLLPLTLPLPDAWRTRLRVVLTRIRPCLKTMQPGQSKTVARVSLKAPSAVIVKLSTQPGRCEALAVLGKDTVLLLGKDRVQILHRGQLYECSVEAAA